MRRVVDSCAMDPILHLSLPVRDLEASRAFYVDMLGCAAGQKGDFGMDVWFYGLQLTLQVQPSHVFPVEEQGCRHFGVTLARADLDELLERLERCPVRWVSPVSTDTGGSGR